MALVNPQPGVLLRGIPRVAAWLRIVLADPDLTERQAEHWVRSGRIRSGRFCGRVVVSTDDALEDLTANKFVPLPPGDRRRNDDQPDLLSAEPLPPLLPPSARKQPKAAPRAKTQAQPPPDRQSARRKPKLRITSATAE